MSKTDDFEAKGILWVYDAAIDDFRSATQDDINRMARAAINGAAVREQAIRLHAEWQKLFPPKQKVAV